jgi:dihydropteroate synthase
MRLRCGNRSLSLAEPLVMGVLNVTPDSFSDGGKWSTADDAIAQGLQMIAEGAALIDVGGESTRPGADPVSVDEELARVLPVVEALAAAGTSAVVSIDTTKPQVMRAAVAVGAALINDVNALRAPGAIEAAETSGAAICLMHMQGEPRTMQSAPRYDEVVADVAAFLRDRVHACERAGITRDRLLIDPGIGFGKRVEHNLALIADLQQLVAIGLPVLVGASRKSLIGTLTDRPTDGRLAGGLAIAALAVRAGAAIIRTHDVAPTVDAVRVAAAIRAAAADKEGEIAR